MREAFNVQTTGNMRRHTDEGQSFKKERNVEWQGAEMTCNRSGCGSRNGAAEHARKVGRKSGVWGGRRGANE